MSGVYALTAADHGAAVAWVVPTYRNSRPAWRFIEQYTAHDPRVSVLKSERIFEFPSEGRIGVYTADNDVSLRGDAFDIVIADEAAMMREETYADVIMPTLADRNGRFVAISTPKGRNWFYREWTKGRNGVAGYASFTAPTSDNPSPSIRQAAQMAREQLSDRTYRQEWLAQFVEDGAGVFRYFREIAVPAQEPQKEDTYVGGLDWALSNDYTVLTIASATQKRVVFADRFTGIDYALQRERIAAACKRYGVSVLVAEQNAMGKPNNDELRRAGLPCRDFNTTNQSKAQLIESLASAIESRSVSLIDSPTLMGELESYESERLPSGAVRYTAPTGMHDDMVMSLALCYYAMTSSSQGVYL